jgi:hypothetical protein
LATVAIVAGKEVETSRSESLAIFAVVWLEEVCERTEESTSSAVGQAATAEKASQV